MIARTWCETFSRCRSITVSSTVGSTIRKGVAGAEPSRNSHQCHGGVGCVASRFAIGDMVSDGSRSAVTVAWRGGRRGRRGHRKRRQEKRTSYRAGPSF
ncbi:hypothetical protein FOTG_18866 [Fusarium oxysporum f. sp. vasinfectum 25433]|uniref:Uncharacterized protein n=1 Tax=Fusarium oxysporum f. sp. vasinfectum 25433 TaxID=1089449 RepID=X0KGJ9_FUSOX|nr:hypothetical protein FOTG_18866 [Fusarium oxysporum f. sp. vasinfectum 25433]